MVTVRESFVVLMLLIPLPLMIYHLVFRYSAKCIPPVSRVPPIRPGVARIESDQGRQRKDHCYFSQFHLVPPFVVSLPR